MTSEIKVGDEVKFEGRVDAIDVDNDVVWITANKNNPEASVEPIAIRFLELIPQLSQHHRLMKW